MIPIGKAIDFPIGPENQTAFTTLSENMWKLVKTSENKYHRYSK